MKTLILLLLTVSCWNPSRTVRSNQTEPVEHQPPFELPLDPPEDDSDRELSSQLEEVNAHWSPWSDWSACSRSCDGGTSHQLRTCQEGPCKGDHIRYKICNMQALAVLFVAVAYSHASGIVLGHGGSARGALEGALGGQWIPDVPVAAHGAGIVAPGLGLGLGLGAPGLGLGIGGLGVAGHGISAKGALEGALGGQWIPDVPVAAHGAGIVAPGLGLGLGLGGVGLGGVGLGHGVASRGAVEGALGGQWIPDTHGK